MTDHEALRAEIDAADLLLDAHLGWELVAQHDAEDYDQGYADGLAHEYDAAMAYSPAYLGGYDAAVAEDSVTEQPGYYESTRPDWF